MLPLALATLDPFHKNRPSLVDHVLATIEQQKLCMIARVIIVSILIVRSTFWPTAGYAEELLKVADFQLSNMCEKVADENQLTSFKIQDDVSDMPMIVLRDAEAKLEIKRVYFKPSFYGMLFTRGGPEGPQSVLHCLNFKTHIDFILLERSERWMIFESGARQATEAHFHSYVGCGTSCVFGRSETIVFFDDPVVPPEEEGWLHSKPMAPLYIHNGDAYPSEYPLRWFRSYLSHDEKILFDQEVLAY